jgi:hypothetical protein
MNGCVPKNLTLKQPKKEQNKIGGRFAFLPQISVLLFSED